MPRIRILTGVHAGATLDLEPGVHRVGSTQDCDIALTDWSLPVLQLSVGADASVRATWRAAPGDTQDRQHLFVAFVPLVFGDVALCVGPVEGAWPSDLQLLRTGLAPQRPRLPRWTGGRAMPVLAGVAALSLCVLGSAALMGSPRAETPPETVHSLAERARAAIEQTGVAGLRVEAGTSGLQVSGLVATAAQARAVRTALDSLASPLPVLQRLTVASEVAESIRSTVGVADAEVRYVGDGVFTFTADSGDTKAVRQAIDRVAADLGEVVRRIDVTLEQGEKKPADVPILSSLKADGIAVVQTRDGVKHLVVTEPERTVTVGKVLSLP